MHDRGEVGVHDDHVGVCVANDVFELGRGMRDRERDRDSAGAPDPPLRRDVSKTRRREKGDARLLQVVAAGKQTRGDASRVVEEIPIRKRAFCCDDRCPITVPPGAGDEGRLRQGRASRTWRILRASARSEKGFCRNATPSWSTPRCSIASSV